MSDAERELLLAIGEFLMGTAEEVVHKLPNRLLYLATQAVRLERNARVTK